MTGIDYPSPPRVHWLVLALVWAAIGYLIDQLAPQPYRNLLNSLIPDAWAFYLCLWIRQLDPESKSAFWCDVYLVVELACASLSIQQHPSVTIDTLTNLLLIASGVLGIATIYLIRADLLKHYNEREPIGIELNGVLTFLFSFLYFQSQLYPIAQLKKRQAEGIATAAGRTLLP
ncbi:MAG: hypothetical protein ABR976_18785 [Terracidiphilus sp.]|jgi:hypothetical protein